MDDIANTLEQVPAARGQLGHPERCAA
jgi:hypothetical protein